MGRWWGNGNGAALLNGKMAEWKTPPTRQISDQNGAKEADRTRKGQIPEATNEAWPAHPLKKSSKENRILGWSRTGDWLQSQHQVKREPELEPALDMELNLSGHGCCGDADGEKPIPRRYRRGRYYPTTEELSSPPISNLRHRRREGQ